MVEAIALSVNAEKSTEYVPPSYLTRFGKSVVFIGITGVCIAGILLSPNSGCLAVSSPGHVG